MPSYQAQTNIETRDELRKKIKREGEGTKGKSVETSAVAIKGPPKPLELHDPPREKIRVERGRGKRKKMREGKTVGRLPEGHRMAARRPKTAPRPMWV